MKIEEIKEKYHFENLTEDHDLSEFDCGDDDLNDFLKNDALKQQKAKLNITKLIICDGKIIGFASLLTDTIMMKKIRDDKVKEDIIEKLNINTKIKTLPAIKIGRLAIDKKFTKKGLGTHILDKILANLKDISENNIGFRFIIIEGYAKAVNFYVL